MVTSQQIIERSLYVALLRVALSIGRTINPEDYLPVSVENQKKQEEAISKLEKEIQRAELEQVKGTIPTKKKYIKCVCQKCGEVFFIELEKAQIIEM